MHTERSIYVTIYYIEVLERDNRELQALPYCCYLCLFTFHKDQRQHMYHSVPIGST